MPAQKVFLLGATGFLGGHVVALLKTKHPDYHLTCLLRHPTPEAVALLQSLNPNFAVIQGTLDDRDIIAQAASEADVVIHMAHSDHPASVNAILQGLDRRIAQAPAEPSPIFLHISGCGIIADNCRGIKVDHIKEWTDIDLDLNDCPPKNPHLAVDRKILEAGIRDQHAIRSFILFPGLIYGHGKGGRSSAWMTLFRDLAQQAGHAGTWGPGEVAQPAIHVEDVAAAIVCVLDAAMEGRIQGGKDGLFFVTSQEPTMTWKELNTILGNMMHERKLLEEPGCRPFSAKVIEPFGDYGWSLFASNGRARADGLAALGWTSCSTKREPLHEILRHTIEQAL